MEETSSKAVELGLSLLHSQQVQDSLRAYHSSVQELVSLFYADSNWDVRLAGPGLDGSYPNLYIRHPEGGYWGISSYPRPFDKAFFVHSRMHVGKENSDGDAETEMTPPSLLLHTTKTADNSGHVRVFMSSRTRSLLQQADYGLPLDESVIVEEDENALPRFFLSGKLLGKQFHANDAHFLLVHPPSIVRLPCSLNHLLNDDDIGSENNPERLGKYIHALFRHIAIPCLQWPSMARQWSGQKRTWPSPDVVQRVQEKGAFLIPAEVRTSTDELAWSYNFEEAERELIGSFTPTQQMCFMLVKDILLNHPMCRNWLTEPHVKYLFFLVLEEESSDVWQGGVVECLKVTLSAMKKYFVAGKLPHYFMPDVNVFDSIPFRDQIQRIANLLTDLTEQGLSTYLEKYKVVFKLWDLKAEEISPQQQQDIRNCVVLRLESKLQVMFDTQVRLLYLQLYARILFCSTMDMRIAKITESIKLIAKLNLSSRIVAPMREILTNFLGTLYLVKVMRLKMSPERSFLAQKAEECFLQSHNMDAMVGKVKLANFFYMTSRWNDCIQLLQEVLQHSGQDRDTYGLDKNPGTDQQQQRTHGKIWLKWINKNYLLPFGLAAMCEKCTVPSIIQKDLSFTSCPVLGAVTRGTVCYLDPEIYARILLVLGLIKVGHKDSALSLLNIVENICDKEHEDENEKRNVSYLNAIAHCYELLGERERSTHNLSRSLAIVPNPRNSARFVLFGYQTEKFRRIATAGLGAAACIGMAAMVIAVVKGRQG